MDTTAGYVIARNEMTVTALIFHHMKIYTKTGDKGTTSLIGGERVPKCDARVEAYGTVDELSAHLALLEDMMRADGRFGEITGWLGDIQNDLMYVEAMLAAGKGGEDKIASLPGVSVGRLEGQIDRMSEGLAPVAGFTIPGGHPIVSQSHVCRTVCRRAERATVGIPSECAISPEAAEYLNRLSDWLYMAGRKGVEILSVKERHWTP